jgi:hypothetical protein
MRPKVRRLYQSINDIKLSHDRKQLAFATVAKKNKNGFLEYEQYIMDIKTGKANHLSSFQHRGRRIPAQTKLSDFAEDAVSRQDSTPTCLLVEVPLRQVWLPPVSIKYDNKPF